MIEQPVGPAAGIVTAGAVALVGALVGIILTVAPGAIGRRILEARAPVAGRAAKVGVPADQRERPQAVVKPYGILPGQGDMAAGAVRAELAGMKVIGSMAVDAGRPEPGLPGRQSVAGGAAEPAMGPDQGKAGLAVVVEGRRLPALRLVTLLAGRAVAPLVNVIFSMAGGAGR